MFLRPQHLQQFSRYVRGLLSETWRQTHPYLWGLDDIEIDGEQLEGFTFAVRRLNVVLPDGTRAATPTSLTVNSRSFKDELRQAEGPMMVWLGVPTLSEGDANAARPEELGGRDLRYQLESVEVADENAGGTPRAMEIRRLRARLFFGNENREGYDCLPIAALERSGQGSNEPKIADSFFPPVVRLGAWEPLQQLAESVLHRVEAKQRFLRAEVQEGRINLEGAGGGSWQAVFKLQIVGSFLHVLRQVIATPGIHPFTVYVELARLAGELSIFEEEGAEAIEVPLYDHTRLGPCFHATVFTVERLLEKILSGRFVHVPFELSGELLIARLQESWLGPKSELFLCIESDLPDRSILSRIETAKIGASVDLPLLKQRRLFGLDIELLSRTPGGLPARSELHYFAINREGPYWESVEREREIAILGGIDPKLRFSLYIVLQPSDDER